MTETTTYIIERVCTDGLTPTVTEIARTISQYGADVSRGKAQEMLRLEPAGGSDYIRVRAVAGDVRRERSA